MIKISPINGKKEKSQHRLLWSIIVACLFFIICPIPATGATLDWEEICPPGFGNLKNYSAFSAAEYEGNLYVGTHNITEGCEIWRFDGPSTSDWTKVSLNGFGNSQNQIPYSMAVYQNKLYVGARNNSANGFEIWSYNSATWTFVTNALALGDGDLKIPASMLVFNGKLVLGAGNSWTSNKAKVYDFDGTNWRQINTDSFGDSLNRQCRSLCEYNGKLYVGTYNNQAGGQLWRYDGPMASDWTAVATNGLGAGNNNQDVRSLCAYAGKLYAGTANTTTGCQIWETSNSVDWVRNDPGTNLYFDATRTMVRHGTNLFVGTGNALGAGGNDPGGQVWRYTNKTWNQINVNGFGFTNSAGKHSHMGVQFLLMKDGYLYAGASDSWNNGGSVWRTWIGLANMPPIASDDVSSTQEDMAVAINVLANDTDEDNDWLTISNVTQGTSGDVVINVGDTNVTYTPTGEWSGVDSFTYTVSDGKGMLDTGTVVVTVAKVNDPPVAGTDAGITLEDTALVINVLTNDTDVDNTSLAIANVTQGSNGTVVISGGGTNVTYTPDGDWNGIDTFTYTLGDWYGGFGTGAVDITVIPVNDAPTIVLVTPTNGNVFWVGGTISLTAAPSDVDGAVTRVLFFADNIQIGQATNLPWQANNTLTNTGQCIITARAWDEFSAVGTSMPVSVTIPFDYDSDYMADTWEYAHGLSPTNAADALNDDDGDTVINKYEYTADTAPHNSNSYFHLTGIAYTNSHTVTFVCTNSRVYSLDFATNMIDGSWSIVNEQTNKPGHISGMMSLTDTNDAPKRNYRVRVSTPK